MNKLETAEDHLLAGEVLRELGRRRAADELTKSQAVEAAIMATRPMKTPEEAAELILRLPGIDLRPDDRERLVIEATRIVAEAAA